MRKLLYALVVLASILTFATYHISDADADCSYTGGNGIVYGTVYNCGGGTAPDGTSVSVWAGGQIIAQGITLGGNYIIVVPAGMNYTVCGYRDNCCRYCKGGVNVCAGGQTLCNITMQVKC